MTNKKIRQLAAIMFTDIVGYTALMQQDEKAAAEVRAKHREQFEHHHEVHHGNILQYFGDGTLSVFQSGVQAVECAIAIQKALHTESPVPLRIGLHVGDIVHDGTEIFGDGVNLASRIENLGIAGAILLSGRLNEELKNQQHISTLSLGHFELKNIAEPVEVFAVSNPGIKIPSRAEVRGKQQTQTKSIAVLPFVNMSADPDNEYFSDGMTEEIINALSKIENLRVTSRTSSFFFKNKHIPIPRIGKELNVSTILEGSVRLAGERMRITAQLIDVVDDFHFWSETFDRSVQDMFAVQDEISLAIADRLREHLGHFDIEEHLIDPPEIPVDQYQAYLKGRYYLLKMSKQDIDKGMDILGEIIEKQPAFALAHIGMHLGYTLLATMGMMPADEAFAKGQPFLDKAIALNPDLPECQLNLSYLAFLQDWDLNATYSHLRRSLEIRPTVEYYQSMASVLVAERKYTAALNYVETAIEIDPFSPINYHLKGFIFYVQEKFDLALELFDKSITLNPDAHISWLYRGQTLILMGRRSEALEYFQQLPDTAEDLLRPGGITLAYAALENVENTKARIKQLEAFLATSQMERAMELLILCHTVMGEHEKAIQLVEQATTHRLPMMVYLAIEPLLKPLNTYDRFRELTHGVLGVAPASVQEGSKYKQPLLDPDTIEEYRARLTELMNSEEPYLDPDLTLRGLAAMLDISPNQLSQLLNEGFNQNFATCVNSYRLETFKSLVADPSQRHLTILAMAYDSGFNSKTVFNTFFKKAMGITPRAYWKEITGQ